MCVKEQKQKQYSIKEEKIENEKLWNIQKYSVQFRILFKKWNYTLPIKNDQPILFKCILYVV